MVEEVLSVPEVTCQHCVAAIEGAVGALAGVERVSVNLERKDVTISHDGAPAVHDRIVSAIKQEGYQVAATS